MNRWRHIIIINLYFTTCDHHMYDTNADNESLIEQYMDISNHNNSVIYMKIR